MTFSFAARLLSRDLDVEFSLGSGETLAVLGPNGAGKSTMLDLMAGLLRADSGRAELDGSVLFDQRPGSRRWTPPHSRGVSLLAQDPLLFPHLSALDNVAFGPRSARMSGRESRATARRWLHEVDAAELADRRPHQLSGGQAQRIAIARALASEPRLLLLDEPMAALDVAVAPVLRRTLKRVLDHRTAIVVTHDILDALVLADRIIVVEGGRIIESGPTRDVLTRPRSAFTADLAALTLLVGVRTPGGLRTADDRDLRTTGGDDISPGAPVAAAVRPSVVSIFTEDPGGATENVVRDLVQDLEPRGDVIRVRSRLISADVSPSRAADLDLASGDAVWFGFAAADAAIYAL